MDNKVYQVGMKIGKMNYRVLTGVVFSIVDEAYVAAAQSADVYNSFYYEEERKASIYNDICHNQDDLDNIPIGSFYVLELEIK